MRENEILRVCEASSALPLGPRKVPMFTAPRAHVRVRAREAWVGGGLIRRIETIGTSASLRHKPGAVGQGYFVVAIAVPLSGGSIPLGSGRNLEPAMPSISCAAGFDRAAVQNETL